MASDLFALLSSCHEGRFVAAQYIVRHGTMRFLGPFEADDGVTPTRGRPVVVRTERGLEVGDVLCEATPRAVELLTEPTSGRIIRAVNDADQAQLDRLGELERAEFATCQRFVSQRRLQMELVDVEHLFG